MTSSLKAPLSHLIYVKHPVYGFPALRTSEYIEYTRYFEPSFRNSLSFKQKELSSLFVCESHDDDEEGRGRHNTLCRLELGESGRYLRGPRSGERVSGWRLIMMMMTLQFTGGRGLIRPIACGRDPGTDDGL